MYIENKEKGIGFGYDILPDRKKPAICIKDRISIYVLGYFNDEKKAQYFMQQVIEILKPVRIQQIGGQNEQLC